jgi:hypothetical protein
MVGMVPTLLGARHAQWPHPEWPGARNDQRLPLVICLGLSVVVGRGDRVRCSRAELDALPTAHGLRRSSRAQN